MFRNCLVVLVLCLSAGSLLYAGEPRLTTRTAIQLDLFSGGIQEQPAAPALQQPSSGGKSPALAALLSLLVPGLGEHYAGDFGAARYLLIAEGSLWLTYAAFDIYGSSLRDDARTFAALHAGIDPRGKDDQFYVDIGNFINVQEFNERRLQDRSPERLYDPQAGYAWQWDSEAARAAFKDKRISAETALNNRKFVVAAIVVNHVVSAINAARLAISHNNALLESLHRFDLSADVESSAGYVTGVRLTLSRTF